MKNFTPFPRNQSYLVLFSLIFCVLFFNKANAQVTIITQPSTVIVCRGLTTDFTVVASGTISGYQWYKNNVAISGATNATYTTPPIVVADEGSKYKVQVLSSNGANQLSNEVSILQVRVATEIDRKSTRLNSSHITPSRMPSSA